MLVFSACIKDYALDEDKADLWFALLEDIPDENFLQAITHLSNSEINLYPGTNIVALIRGKVNELAGGSVPVDAMAELAYDKIVRAFERWGKYRTVVFDDPTIHAVLDSKGGWIAYCNTPDGELKWYRKEFVNLYKLYAPLMAQGLIRFPAELPGLWASEVTATDKAKLPVFIGDKQKFLEWSKKKALAEGEGQKKLEG